MGIIICKHERRTFQVSAAQRARTGCRKEKGVRILRLSLRSKNERHAVHGQAVARHSSEFERKRRGQESDSTAIPERMYLAQPPEASKRGPISRSVHVP